MKEFPDCFIVGYYYTMIESAILADKLIYILKDRKCYRVHRKTMEYLIKAKLSIVPCFRFMDMDPLKAAMLVSNGVHCTVFYDGRPFITKCDPITQGNAECIVDHYDHSTVCLYRRYLIEYETFSSVKYQPLQDAVAYYEKKGLL